MKNYFEVLELNVGATDADIKAAYRRLARTCHPDLCGAAGEGRFAELSEAYRFLSDRIKRATLELELGSAPAARPAEAPRPEEKAPASDAGHTAAPAARIAKKRGDKYVELLEHQIESYEKLLGELSGVLPAGTRRELSRVSISALVRRNREMRAASARTDER